MDREATLSGLEARLDRFVQVAELVWRVVWWMYLIALLVIAYINRETLGWDEIKFAGIVTVGLILAMIVLTGLILGALHAWKLALLPGMVGGCAGQLWGCVIGIGISGAIGLVVLFFDARPLREERRRARLMRSA